MEKYELANLRIEKYRVILFDCRNVGKIVNRVVSARGRVEGCAAAEATPARDVCATANGP